MWPEWHAKAACLGEVDTTFFGSSEPSERPPYTISDIRNARQLCQNCPVFELCLRHAISNFEEYGVWASTTTKERQRYFKSIKTGEKTAEEIIQMVLGTRDG